MKSFTTATLLAAAAFTLTVGGCAKSTDAPKAPAASTDSAKTDVFAALSPEDRAKAIAQRICPVTGDELGGMGTPYKVKVQGREVFLCCEGCLDTINGDPAKYFAILDGAKKPEGDAKADADAKTDAKAAE